jgi:hypothetical protein
MRYLIQFGWDAAGRPRNRYYRTLADASQAASDYFRRTGIVVSITTVPVTITEDN